METTVVPVVFEPQVMARVAPDLSLQRHLSLGVRPCLRAFDEFRNLQIVSGAEELGKTTTLGSSMIRSGNCTVFCKVTGGIVEEFLPRSEVDESLKEYEKIYEKSDGSNDKDKTVSNQLSEFRSVYPVVEVERGRSGPPTEEEMVLSQQIHEQILINKVLRRSALGIDIKFKQTGSTGQTRWVSQKEVGDGVIADFASKKYSFVLSCYIQVFGRNGPLFDTVWTAVMAALRNTKLPAVYIDEDVDMDVLDDSGKISGKNQSMERHQLVCDITSTKPLQLEHGDVCSTTFGVVSRQPQFSVASDSLEGRVDGFSEVPEIGKPILLADVEGDAEESCVESVISVVTGTGDKLGNVSICGGSERIGIEEIRKAIQLAKKKAVHIQGTYN